MASCDHLAIASRPASCRGRQVIGPPSEAWPLRVDVADIMDGGSGRSTASSGEAPDIGASLGRANSLSFGIREKRQERGAGRNRSHERRHLGRFPAEGRLPRSARAGASPSEERASREKR
jgi:hypothetical protein